MSDLDARIREFLEAHEYWWEDWLPKYDHGLHNALRAVLDCDATVRQLDAIAEALGIVVSE